MVGTLIYIWQETLTEKQWTLNQCPCETENVICAFFKLITLVTLSSNVYSMLIDKKFVFMYIVCKCIQII